VGQASVKLGSLVNLGMLGQMSVEPVAVFGELGQMPVDYSDARRPCTLLPGALFWTAHKTVERESSSIGRRQGGGGRGRRQEGAAGLHGNEWPHAW